MSGGPTAAMLMSTEVRHAVFDERLLERLRRSVTVVEVDGGLPGSIEILITGWGCPPLTARTLAGLPRLTAVVHAAGSVKGCLPEAVWRRGITVSSAAEANAEPVADFTFAAIILAGRRSWFHARRYAEGRFVSLAHGGGCGNDGRVVGVVGASRVGRGVIARLVGAGHYRVLVADPYLEPAEAGRLQVEQVDLDELCRSVDVVTLHAPALPGTHHLLDERRLGLLRDGAVVVNTARGTLIDTAALTRHCAAGRLDAVLDVTDPEPLPPGHPLLTLPNVLVTPHLAGAQGSERRRLGEFAVAEVERIVRGEPLRGEVRQADLPTIA